MEAKEAIMARARRQPSKGRALPPEAPGPHNVNEAVFLEVGRQGDGAVYGIDAFSQDRIRENYPDAQMLPDVVLGLHRDADCDRLHRRYWPQVAMMLTGLTAEELAALGGVRLWDPEAGKIIWEWQPTAATSQEEATPPSCSGTAGNHARDKGHARSGTGT
jgi:hypothetical protein